MSDIVIKAGDTFPVLSVTIVNQDDDTPVDLTGATVVFRMAPDSGGAIVLSATASVRDGVNGVLEYNWAPGQTDTPGRYRGEFIITMPSGKVMTAPNTSYLDVRIVERLPDA